MRQRPPIIRRRAPAWQVLVAAIAASGVLSSPAFAQDDDEDAVPEDEYCQSGFYLSGMGLYAVEFFDDTGSVGTDDSFGASGRIGYRLIPNFALEGQFEWLNDFELTLNEADLDGKLRIWTATANAKAFLLTGRLQPYLLAGVGFGEAETDLGRSDSTESGFVSRFGGGVDLYANRDIGVSLEGAYVLPTGDLDDRRYFTIGLGIFLRFYGQD